MTKILGNDISHYQKNIDFSKYKFQFLIMKTTEGVDFIDSKFTKNQSGARKAGILVGYYHFARPDLGNDPVAEADFFIKTIGTLQDGEVLALDYECANQTQAHITWCRKWLDRVFEKTDIRAFIYLNQSLVKKFDWKLVIDGNYALWIAAYTHNPNKNKFVTGQWATAAMQQWTNRQAVPGIRGGVDGDVFFGSLDTLKKYGYKKAISESTPSSAPAKFDANADLSGEIEEDVELKDYKLYNNPRRFVGLVRFIDFLYKRKENAEDILDQVREQLIRFLRGK